MEIIKYEGNSKYIVILYKEKDKLYVLYALTNALFIDSENEEVDIDDCFSRITKFVLSRHVTVHIPLIERENNKVFSIIQVDNEKAYDLIKTVVEDLL